MELAYQPPRILKPVVNLLSDLEGNPHPLLARGSLSHRVAFQLLIDHYAISSNFLIINIPCILIGITDQFFFFVAIKEKTKM
jgi:hypothetical protein